MAKGKFVRITSPIGALRYPRITEPDYKFDADGVYSTRLILPQHKAVVLMERIDAGIADKFKETVEAVREEKGAAAAKKVKQADPPYAMVLDDDTGEETGDVEFRLKLKAIGRDKSSGREWQNKVVIFDGHRQPIKAGINVWGGTEAVVAFDLIPYHTDMVGAGISLRLRAVQIIKLVNGTDDDPDAYGFDEVEDSFAFDGGGVMVPAAGTPDAQPEGVADGASGPAF